MIRYVLNQPPVPYIRTFKDSDLTTTKLSQTFDDGTKNSKSCPMFSGLQGTEGLLYCTKIFDEISTKMRWSEGYELFDNFPEILTGEANDEWHNLLREHYPPDGNPPDDADVDAFNLMHNALVMHYAHEDGKAHMQDYMSHDFTKKPYNVTCSAHESRWKTLTNYTKKLSGPRPDWTDDVVNQNYFKTFPEAFQMRWTEIHPRGLRNTTMKDITQYMENLRNLELRAQLSGGRNDQRERPTSNFRNSRTTHGGRGFGGRGHGRRSGRGHQPYNNNSYGSGGRGRGGFNNYHGDRGRSNGNRNGSGGFRGRLEGRNTPDGSSGRQNNNYYGPRNQGAGAHSHYYHGRSGGRQVNPRVGGRNQTQRGRAQRSRQSYHYEEHDGTGTNDNNNFNSFQQMPEVHHYDQIGQGNYWEQQEYPDEGYYFDDDENYATGNQDPSSGEMHDPAYDY